MMHAGSLPGIARAAGAVRRWFVKVYCDSLGDFVQLPEKPLRIVSLVAGFTETLVEIGYGHAIVGISEFFRRFSPRYRLLSLVII